MGLKKDWVINYIKMKRENWVLIGLLGVFVIVYYFFTLVPRKELNANYRYTIGDVMRIDSQSEGAKAATYYYYYRNRQYTGIFSIDSGYENKFKVGSRIFVKFSPDDPDNSQIEYDIIVSDNLVSPKEGWKEIPR